MATCRIRENLSVEEVLERLDALDADPSIVYDSSESEIEDDGVVAVFPENSVGIEDNSGERPSLSDEECESSSESEVDRNVRRRATRQVSTAPRNHWQCTWSKKTPNSCESQREEGRKPGSQNLRWRSTICLVRGKHQQKLKTVYKCCWANKTR